MPKGRENTQEENSNMQPGLTAICDLGMDLCP